MGLREEEEELRGAAILALCVKYSRVTLNTQKAFC